MNPAQAAEAIAELEAEGHLFSLKSDGRLVVTNVTPPLAKFVQRNLDVLKAALSSRNLTTIAGHHFPCSQVVRLEVSEDLRSRWNSFARGFTHRERLELLARVIAALPRQREPIELFEEESKQ